MSEFATPDGLFRVDGEDVYLQASTSSVSESLVFPPEAGQDRVELGPTGVLYSWTSQEFPPPSPPALPDGEFRRYGVGYLEFPEGLLVEGRLTTCDPDDLEIGGAMKIVIIPFAGGDTFAFMPIGSCKSNRSK